MKKRKKRLKRIIFGSILFILGIIVRSGIIDDTDIIYKTNIDVKWIELVIFTAGFMVAGGSIMRRAARNILHGQVFDENFLMSIASIGAFFIGEYPEGLAVMLFYQVGELFQSYAVDQSRKSIKALMDIRPDYANVMRGGELIQVEPDEVKVGEIIIIKAGEKVPLDGKVMDGSSMVDTSALTGESIPREVFSGDGILSGSININGMLTIEVTKEYGESTVSKILELVENATVRKAKTENFITKFARYYTPVVVILAVLLSIVPPLVIGTAKFSDWVYRGLTFLVISCPCALVVSIPLSFFGGIGAASRKGILVKGSNYLEALTRAEMVIFDKTGTLTKGVFNVQEIHAENMDSRELLEITSYAEHYSNHPISLSLKKAYGKEIDPVRITDVEEMPGFGVRAVIDGRTVLAGNERLMKSMKIKYDTDQLIGTVVHTAVNGMYAGYIIISDEIKEDSIKAVELLKAAGIKKTVMLTGDVKNVGERTAKKLGLDVVYTDLLPADKVDKLEELLLQKSEKGKVIYVGDGINDAPVLARADIGIAMGGLGSDAAIEAADVIIMTDEPSKISTAINISKRTISIVKQNIIFSLAVKFLILILASFGLVSMAYGVVADVGVTLLAVANAARALNVSSVTS